MPKKDLSIIMPVLLHHRYLLNMTLASIRNIKFFTHPYNVEIIVVHNRSDLFDQALQEWLDKDDIYIANEKNERLGKCFNQGIAQASSDYICVMANDILVHQNWFPPLKQVLDDGVLDFVGPYHRRHWGDYEEQSKNPDIVSSILGTSFTELSNCFVFKKKSYKIVGDFDENIYVFCDRDYQIRIGEKDLKPGMSLESYVTHLGSMTWLNRHEQLENEKFFGWNFWEKEDEDNTYFLKKWGHKT